MQQTIKCIFKGGKIVYKEQMCVSVGKFPGDLQNGSLCRPPPNLVQPSASVRFFQCDNYQISYLIPPQTEILSTLGQCISDLLQRPRALVIIPPSSPQIITELILKRSKLLKQSCTFQGLFFFLILCSIIMSRSPKVTEAKMLKVIK